MPISIELRSLVDNRTVKSAAAFVISGQVGCWSGYAVSILSNVAIAPLMLFLGGQYLIRTGLEYVLDDKKLNLKAHHISLIKAGVEALTCTAIIVTCLAVGVLAPPVLGLIVGVSATYIAYNLYKANEQYDVMVSREKIRNSSRHGDL